MLARHLESALALSWAFLELRCDVREELLTIDEVAAKARISVRTLYRLIATSRGPSVMEIGARRFVREDHLSTWMESNIRQPGHEAA